MYQTQSDGPDTADIPLPRRKNTDEKKPKPNLPSPEDSTISYRDSGIDIPTQNLRRARPLPPLFKKPPKRLDPDDVSIPSDFEHLVHIEDVYSNENNYVLPKASGDATVREMFQMINRNITENQSMPIRRPIPPAQSAKPGRMIPLAKLAPATTDRRDMMNSSYYGKAEISAPPLSIRTTPLENDFAPLQVSPRGNADYVMPGGRRPTDFAPASDLGNDQQWSSTPMRDPSLPYTGSPPNQLGVFSPTDQMPLPTRKYISYGFSETTDEASPVTPMTPFTPFGQQYTDKPQNFKSRTYENISEITRSPDSPVAPPRKRHSQLYSSQEATPMNENISKNDLLEPKKVSKASSSPSPDDVEQVLQNLDEVLEEQKSESSRSVTPKSPRPIEGNVRLDSEGTEKRSVKELAEMLSSINIEPMGVYRAHRSPLSRDGIQKSNDSEGLDIPATSEEASDSNAVDERSKSKDLKLVNIFGMGEEKSLAEIIAKKRAQNKPPPPPSTSKPKLKPIDNLKLNVEPATCEIPIPVQETSVPSSGNLGKTEPQNVNRMSSVDVNAAGRPRLGSIERPPRPSIFMTTEKPEGTKVTLSDSVEAQSSISSSKAFPHYENVMVDAHQMPTQASSSGAMQKGTEKSNEDKAATSAICNEGLKPSESENVTDTKTPKTPVSHTTAVAQENERKDSGYSSPLTEVQGRALTKTPSKRSSKSSVHSMYSTPLDILNIPSAPVSRPQNLFAHYNTGQKVNEAKDVITLDTEIPAPKVRPNKAPQKPKRSNESKEAAKDGEVASTSTEGTTKATSKRLSGIQKPRCMSESHESPTNDMRKYSEGLEATKDSKASKGQSEIKPARTYENVAALARSQEINEPSKAKKKVTRNESQKRAAQKSVEEVKWREEEKSVTTDVKEIVKKSSPELKKPSVEQKKSSPEPKKRSPETSAPSKNDASSQEKAKKIATKKIAPKRENSETEQRKSLVRDSSVGTNEEKTLIRQSSDRRRSRSQATAAENALKRRTIQVPTEQRAVEKRKEVVAQAAESGWRPTPMPRQRLLQPQSTDNIVPEKTGLVRYRKIRSKSANPLERISERSETPPSLAKTPKAALVPPMPPPRPSLQNSIPKVKIALKVQPSTEEEDWVRL